VCTRAVLNTPAADLKMLDAKGVRSEVKYNCEHECVKDGTPTEEGHKDKLFKFSLECHKYCHQDAGLQA
jgi:hypothetical protein